MRRNKEMSILGLVKDVVDSRTSASASFHVIQGYTVSLPEKTVNIQFATYVSVDAYKGGFEPVNGYSLVAKMQLENVDVVSLDALYGATANYLDGLNYFENVASVLADAKNTKRKVSKYVFCSLW